MARTPEVADLFFVFIYFLIDIGMNLLTDQIFFFFILKNVNYSELLYVCRMVTKYMYISPHRTVRVLFFCCYVY